MSFAKHFLRVCQNWYFLWQHIRIQESGVRIKRQPAKDFQDLIVWQKAHQLVLSIYRVSDSFPQSELYGLTFQAEDGAEFCLLASVFQLSTQPCLMPVHPGSALCPMPNL